MLAEEKPKLFRGVHTALFILLFPLAEANGKLVMSS